MATEYVVLAHLGGEHEDDWRQVGRAEADTDIQAIKAVVPKEEEGTFVAVPARSFRPRTRKVETKTVDRWS